MGSGKDLKPRVIKNPRPIKLPMPVGFNISNEKLEEVMRVSKDVNLTKCKALRMLLYKGLEAYQSTEN